MAKTAEPTIIKKYANRRLYNTGTSSYVTLEDLAAMVKRGEDFVVSDAKTGEDITRSVLTQIIFEQENKGPNLLPVNFLRQLIRFYGDSIQNLVPSYLEVSMASLTREQERFREQMTKALGANGVSTMEEQVRANMALFERAMKMFVPFGVEEAAAAAAAPAAAAGNRDEELDALKREMNEMRNRLDRLSVAKPH
ncbi:MAG TPA: polyhydroxyalkanoate synthesis repressor PhaR [Hyphomicrobiales bacterium]|nr:polyhydroxyalkanoate synthesis repressor PhaR [Hyphomicrobiales bacterium]